MADHEITRKDQLVNGQPGTVVTCKCGWREAWGVQDGSAEADAHHHMMEVSPEYRERFEASIAKWRAEHPVLASPASAPLGLNEHSHNCSCHISAPCGRCENCRHGNEPDCEEDCQTCEIDHEGASHE